MIDEVIAQVERPGWEERLRYAETLRLKGWMLLLKGDPDGAERNFLASLDTKAAVGQPADTHLSLFSRLCTAVAISSVIAPVLCYVVHL